MAASIMTLAVKRARDLTDEDNLVTIEGKLVTWRACYEVEPLNVDGHDLIEVGRDPSGHSIELRPNDLVVVTGKWLAT